MEAKGGRDRWNGGLGWLGWDMDGWLGGNTIYEIGLLYSSGGETMS